MTHRFADEKADLDPRSWLSKYRRNSIGYIIKMMLFYHGVGFLLLWSGSHIIEQTVTNYEAPNIPRSLSSVLAAGPFEETAFFGIPFYLLGNTYVVLATGALWAILHLFNTSSFTLNGLAFGNMFFVIPSLFFSLRTWASGKGWFAVIVHTVWNWIIFAIGCTIGDLTCTSIDNNINSTIDSILLSTILLMGTYFLYKRRESKERRRLAV